MAYNDKIMKFISKHTKLTGVESKNIVKQLNALDIDYQLIDWKTIGENLYGYGKRSAGVKKQIKDMYGLSLGKTDDFIEQKYSEIEIGNIMPKLMEINDRRSKRSRMIDYSLTAKNVFEPTDKIGVMKWMKNPNRYDIKGLDD